MQFDSAQPLASNTISTSCNKGLLVIAGASTGVITLSVDDDSGTPLSLTSITAIPAYTAFFIPFRVMKWTGANVTVYELF